MKLLRRAFVTALLPLCCISAYAAGAVDFSKAVVVSRPGVLPDPEKTAATVLVEEVQKRTGLRLESSTSWPQGRPVIAITSAANVAQWSRSVPRREGAGLPETRTDGYRLYLDTSNAVPVAWIVGADPRATIYGVGDFLRKADWAKGQLSLSAPLDIASAPAYPIRGHQLGYRAQANSYDAWSPAQVEQYIRELAFFGVNSIEGIPFQDERPTPVMKYPRRDMNRIIGEICKRYGMDYWAWVPADFDLKDAAKRQHLLDQCAEFFKDTPEFTGFFFPGGDPGGNPPQLVFPFLEDVAKLLKPTHPQARIWLSVQQFKQADIEYVYNYVNQQLPPWLGGLVAGPSSPPLGQMRNRLPKQYGLRDYPDLTHNKLSQYEVPEWDQAYALTEGREAVNPRAAQYAAIFHRFAAYTDGFISYSDGIHDDVNKTIWSALSWNPNQSVRDILVEYARVYFSPAVAQDAADGLLALETNWRGPLIHNGSVDGTLLRWQQMEKAAPELESNWRWQMCLLRANYDAYIRSRLMYETKLESEANAVMAKAKAEGSDRSMSDAAAILNRAVEQPIRTDLHNRIADLCEKLYHSIGLQTSVPKYFAIGEERGAVLDFVDYPLNNRWWLEDQFKAIRALPTEDEKDRRLYRLASWEHPGPGSFYDNLGNIAKSPDVVHLDPENGPELARQPGTTFWWWDQGKSRARLSWQVSSWPTAVVYEALDPNATYIVRSTGAGQALLRINGDRVEPTLDGKQMGEFKEFPVAPSYLKDRRIILTWDRPTNEGNLNWRNKSRLSEVWLIKVSSSEKH